MIGKPNMKSKTNGNFWIIFAALLLVSICASDNNFFLRKNPLLSDEGDHLFKDRQFDSKSQDVIN